MKMGGNTDNIGEMRETQGGGFFGIIIKLFYFFDKTLADEHLNRTKH